MSELLPLNPDELLTTTRAVRKRLDFTRPVPVPLVKELIEIATQAPTGSNSQTWHWVIITEQELKDKIAHYYKTSFDMYRSAGFSSESSPNRKNHSDVDTMNKVVSSSVYLSENLAQAPVLVIAAIDLGSDLPQGNQASIWGSLLPAAWSFALAARARGLGTVWTTLHLAYEKDIAQLLGIPDGVHQGVLFPLAYTKGTDFKPGPRRDLDPIIHVNKW